MATDLYVHPDYYNMDDLLTEEQKLVRDAARAWVKKEVSPIIDEHYEKATFPMHLLRGLGEIGAFGPYIPEEYGGPGLDQISYGLIMQELERCDSGLRSTASVQSSLVMYPIWKYGSEEQKMKYLVELASGQKIGAFLLSEPEAGSDATSQRTTAVDMGDYYLMNGTKNWITNGNSASYYLVIAQTDVDKKHKGINAFIVEKAWDGVTVGKKEDKLGIRGSDTHSIMFQDVKVPKANRIGEDGFGFKFAMKVLSGGRIGIAAQALGIASGAYELSLKYSKERKAFGTEIMNHQAIAFKLADMATEIEAARLLCLKAAWMKDEHMNYDRASSMAKLFASEVAMKTAVEAVQIHGGYGYVKEYHVERMMRDAKITQIYEGTSEVQRVVISRDILK